jgi:hypothetical protein
LFQELEGGRGHPLGLEAEFVLQFLERRGGAEGFHADNAALGADIALAAEDRALLDRGNLPMIFLYRPLEIFQNRLSAFLIARWAPRSSFNPGLIPTVKRM